MLSDNTNTLFNKERSVEVKIRNEIQLHDNITDKPTSSDQKSISKQQLRLANEKISKKMKLHTKAHYDDIPTLGTNINNYSNESVNKVRSQLGSFPTDPVPVSVPESTCCKGCTIL